MTQRTLIPTTVPMARRLTRLDAATRACPAAAAAALQGDFLPDQIAAHLSEAMALAVRFAELAASDRPWALTAGYVRDVLSLAVLIGFGVYGWMVLA